MTIGIMAIFVTLAAPAFTQMIAKSNTRAITLAFEDDLRLARVEAKTRIATTNSGMFVTLCPLKDNQKKCYRTTGGTKWAENGWMIFLDANNNGQYNSAADTLIKKNTDYANKNISLSLTTNPTNNIITFGLTGPILAASISPITIKDSSNTYTHTIAFDESTGQTIRKEQ